MLIACPDCAAIQEMPPPPPHGRLDCCRCGHVFENTTGRSVDAALACALATLMLLIPANGLTLMTVHVAGIDDSTHLASGLGTFWAQGWPAPALILGLQGIVLPFLRFGLLAATLLAVRFGVRGGWVGPAFRWS
ncbi:MAG TPA: paraquat-inducible protein A, partial [Acetobacteraceae bacterium]|nr:paraquat-inducible protein A [Acetobacteraceae bacterium]